MDVGKKSTKTTGESPTTVNCSSSDKPITEREIEIVNTYYKPFSSLKEANSISQLKEIGDHYWRLMENLELMTISGALGSVARPRQKYVYIHLSLVYDTVRGNPNGSITEVDRALDVTHEVKNTFTSAHVGIILRQVCAHRKEEEETNKKKRKRQSLLKVSSQKYGLTFFVG